MEPAITIKLVFLALGTAQGLFLALTVVSVRRGNTIANRFLALLLLTFTIDLCIQFLIQSRYLAAMPRLFFITLVSSFLYGPLVYLYTRALTTGPDFRFSARGLWHFAPFVISIFLLIPFYGLSNNEVLELVYSDPELDERLGLWLLGGLAVQILPSPVIGIYIFLTFRSLIRHGRAIRNQFSSIDRISLVWLRNLLIALLLLFVISVVAVFLAAPLGLGQTIDDIFYVSVVVVIYAMGYLGLRQPIIFARDSGGKPVRKKYEKSAIDTEMSNALLAELRQHMTSARPYLDSNLTLAELARQLKISSNYLSQVINEQTGKNFFDFVNEHRVEAAKRVLADPDRSGAKVLTIAMDAGFNSKTAFYEAFRKHVGQTPRQYRLSVVHAVTP